MKIGFFGDSIWAQKALNLFIESKYFSVEFVVPRFNNSDNELINMAKKNNIPVLTEKNVNGKNFFERLKKYKVDLNVSMSFDQIIKNELISFAPKGFINCHAGALPFYRGRNVLNWALINGENEFGITVHYIDEGIDTGDIILQKMVKIRDTDTYADLLEKAYILCPKVLYEAAKLILNNEVVPIPQSTIHPVGFYCGRRLPGDEKVDWNWSSEKIYNFIRGISTPGPCATTYRNKEIIKIEDAQLIKGAPIYIGTPGEIVGRSSDCVVVKTGDSTIKITKIIRGNGNAELPLFKIGDRLS